MRMAANNGFDTISPCQRFTCNDMSLNNWYCENINKRYYGTGENYQYRNLQGDVYFEATRFRIVPFLASSPQVCMLHTIQLVIEICTVVALTALGIWQSACLRVGIKSTNLHIVVYCTTTRHNYKSFRPECEQRNVSTQWRFVPRVANLPQARIWHDFDFHGALTAGCCWPRQSRLFHLH